MNSKQKAQNARNDSRLETERENRTPGTSGEFPGHRLFWSLIPALFVFFYFPFRALQWVSLLAILILLGAFTFSWLLYHGTAVRSIIPVTYAYRNDEIPVEFEVRNISPFPAVNLGLTVFTPSDIPGRQKVLTMLTLTPRTSERFVATIRMTRRGEYGVSPVVLEGSDPFGFFPWKLTFRNLTRLVVYPAIHHGVLIPKRGVPGGAIRVRDRIYEDVNRIGSIRDYIPGDDIRRIHWKVTAKTGQLCVSELLPAMDAPAMILFDMDTASYPLKYRYELIEDAVEIVASLVHALGDMQQRVGLIANGLDGDGHPVIPPANRNESAALALRVLARITASSDVDNPISMFLAAGISIQAGMSCFIVSPKPPGALAPQLMHPTMVTLHPVYYHLDERKSPASPGLSINYVPLKEPQELFGSDTRRI